MPRPTRIRRIVKWTGVGLSTLLVIVWVLSLFYWAAVTGYYQVSVTFGQVQVGRFAGSRHEYEELYKYEPPAELEYKFRIGKMAKPLAERMRFSLQLPGVSTQYYQDRTPYFRHFFFGLWLPLLLTAIPTAWLWHRDRRLFSSPPDHLSCRGCGYDLTGNLSGVCPECGEKTARREETVESRK